MVETKLLEQIVKEELHDEQVEINLASGGWTADTYILRSSGEESFILKVRNVLNPFESEVLKKMSESDLLFITPES